MEEKRVNLRDLLESTRKVSEISNPEFSPDMPPTPEPVDTAPERDIPGLDSIRRSFQALIDNGTPEELEMAYRSMPLEAWGSMGS